ncbi:MULTISPECIES: caspase domain-containing protein [Rhizobium]|uniref:Peptidase C14 caspase domain-containing protein n=1 Tax=Rhizobium leguminosarum bv. viciae TaxID=387 RepID=A0A8G2IT90_RHILV|nr:caspase family protein [Rhizobium leguminosarum]MBY5393159.1 hypothetical protein [Rhizobium leguminosarum]MBY5435135.1 hypothetical protein [Rhizobium leguminosarum]NEK46977.1 hypothetical protein [Rhizobium leguminosarum]NKK10767.1 hypothetical protein [Rhizobium leguminosarum bv. viciae]NKK24233.1 hypothetical protein [Rhizobium leguminosarum bv. viciae]
MCASKLRRKSIIWNISAAVFLLMWSYSWDAHADDCNDLIPDEIASRVFFENRDNRSVLEQALNVAGMSRQGTSPGFALLAGVSHYPKLPKTEQELKPAAEDIKKLANYLVDQEHFDEVVVLFNDDMTEQNLGYFFRDYFPCRLEKRKAQKPRFLFAYSGHGVNAGGVNGYLLTSDAVSLTARPRTREGVDLRIVRVQFDNIIEAGYQTLALINACFSGYFVRQAFGERILPPQREGAFAITAGGANELTWHDASLGSGSIFFEHLLLGLDGRASLTDDGVVSVNELSAYLKDSVSVFSEDRQNPRPADLMVGGSPGGFFFLDRRKQVENGVVTAWNPSALRAFGGLSSTPRSANPAEPHGGGQPRRLEQYRAWGVYSYIDNSGAKVCYALTIPQEMSPSSAPPQEIFYILQRRQDGSLEHSFVANKDLDEQYKVQVSVDRAVPVDFFSRGKEAWIENSSSEGALTTTFKAGARMSVDAPLASGRTLRYEFMLDGISSAIERLERCAQ